MAASPHKAATRAIEAFRPQIEALQDKAIEILRAEVQRIVDKHDCIESFVSGMGTECFYRTGDGEPIHGDDRDRYVPEGSKRVTVAAWRDIERYEELASAAEDIFGMPGGFGYGDVKPSKERTP